MKGSVILRKFQDFDLENLHDYRNDSSCSQYQRWEETTGADLEYWIDVQKNRDLDKDKSISLAIAHDQTNKLIGDIYLAIKDQTITLGYTISPKFQRQGYAYHILSNLIPQLFNRYEGYEIVCLIHPDNIASRKLIEKLSFEDEGYVPQIESQIYSLRLK